MRARTRIEREFGPDSVRRLKESAGRDLSVGGAELAAQAIKDGSSTITCSSIPLSWVAARPPCPTTSASTSNCSMQHRFSSGVVHLHYRQTDATLFRELSVDTGTACARALPGMAPEYHHDDSGLRASLILNEVSMPFNPDSHLHAGRWPAV